MRRLRFRQLMAFIGVLALASLASAQQAAFPEAICWRDQMPEKGEVDLTNYLPFLALSS